jgi:hypothetical protein
MAGATGLQGNSLEAIASKLSVEEDIPVSFSKPEGSIILSLGFSTVTVKYRFSFSTPSIKPPLLGIGALATASVVVKPLKWLQDLVDAEGEEIASTEIMAGATGLQGNSLEAIASKVSFSKPEGSIILSLGFSTVTVKYRLSF